METKTEKMFSISEAKAYAETVTLKDVEEYAKEVVGELIEDDYDVEKFLTEMVMIRYWEFSWDIIPGSIWEVCTEGLRSLVVADIAFELSKQLKK